MTPWRAWLVAGAVMCTHLAVARNHAPDLPAVAETDTAYTYERVCARMKHRPLHPVEGVWQLTADGACIAIERCDSPTPRSLVQETVYRIVLLESPDRSARSGSVIGYIRPTATSNLYNARLYTSISGGRICNPRGFIMELSEPRSADGMPGSLVLMQDKPSLRINVWNLLPYLYRRVVSRNEPRREIDGCVRVFPLSSKPRFPIYL